MSKRFKKEVEKYKLWCRKNGYPSKDKITLLWYFNRKKLVTGGNGEYHIKFNGKIYSLSELAIYFLEPNDI